MTNSAAEIEVAWIGPYCWPRFESENGLPPIPEIPGVYLWTFEYQDGYLIYVVGITRRSVPQRFGEHTLEYMNGRYHVLDVDAAQQGIRKLIWEGWEYARAHRDEFKEKKSMILDAVQKQLAGFRIFVAEVGKEARILERLEAAIMNNLYDQPSPICDIPDRGMHLEPRWDSEKLIIVKNRCEVCLHGLPARLEI